MQLIKAYFEGEETKILAYVVGFSSQTEGIGIVGFNEFKNVYSTPITLYSGVSNPVKISCLNSDQKKINVSNVTIQLGLFQPGTQNELISITAANVDAGNGVVEVIFTPGQLAPLDFGFYEVALTAVDANLVAYPVYIDDNYGSRLLTTLAKGPVLAYPDPIPVTFTDQPTTGVTSNQIDLTQRPMNSTLATLEANLTAYTGNITAQGSLVSLPTSVDWANISSSAYSNVTGSIFQSVTGSYAQLRFIVNGIDPGGAGNISQGIVDSIINSGNIRI